MNYLRIHNEIIEKRRTGVITDGYYEKHHIVPKSHGGSNDTSNLVKLTAREHFIAHWLLWRIHRDAPMAYAFNCMTYNKYGKRYSNSRGFTEARKAFAKAHSESLKGKEAYNKGKPMSDDQKEKLRQVKLGVPMDRETKERISATMKGVPKSEETKARMKEAQKNLVYFECIHCSGSFRKCNLNRWHNDNCKLKP